MGGKIGSGASVPSVFDRRLHAWRESFVRSGLLGTAPLPAATLDGVRSLLPRPI